MSNAIVVPICLDALVLTATEDAVGPTLDVTRAPWFGADRSGVVRDHFPQSANVTAALRHDPMTPNNVHLRSGTHLHWALPDALTRGETRKPGAGYVQRNGMWFPVAPNRWIVTRSQTGRADESWFIESDFVHPWNARDGAGAVAYPLPPGNWPHPYARVGRAYRLGDAVPTQHSVANLASLDAPLTVMGPNDASFAALYPSCHSIFGHYVDDVPDVPVQYDVIGWYGAAGEAPLHAWNSLPTMGDTDQQRRFIAGLFNAQTGQKLSVDRIMDWDAATQAATEQWASDQTGWTLSGAAHGFGDCDTLLFYGQTRITPQAQAKPGPVTGTVAVGNSGNEAISALFARTEQMSDLEETLEAVSFDTELKDHSLDRGFKMQEYRHTAGFAPTGARVIWTIRPEEDAVSNPFATTNPTQDRASLDLPGDLAHLLNRLNLAQVDMDKAVDAQSAIRQRVFSDWQILMEATYPPDDTADFPVDIDHLRDFILAESRAELAATQDDLDPALQGSPAARLGKAKADMEAALARFVADHPDTPRLRMVATAGPRYWVPRDPVVAIDGGAALAESRRHGQKNPNREDGKIQCFSIDLARRIDAAHALELRQSIAATASAAQPAFPDFSAVALSAQTYRTWNPILLEWQAQVIGLEQKTNLRTEMRAYDPDVITGQFTLKETDCDLTWADAGGYPTTAQTHYYVSGRTVLMGAGTHLLETRLTAYIETLTADKLPVPKALQHMAKTLKTRNQARGPNPVRTLSLGGLTERLLMRRLEAQLPVDDPLGFAGDRALATELRAALGAGRNYYSAEPDAPFMPLRVAELRLDPGRVIDSFGQYIAWHPGGLSGSDVVAAKALNDKQRIVLPPRSAQPARLDLRWRAASDGLIESNDHPATSPLCGWLVPNDFDQNVLVYDAAGQMQGMVDATGVWRSAPGRATAPSGPGQIDNPHLARVVRWLTTRAPDFVQTFLDAVDTALHTIDPRDYATQNAAALLVGRPIAVARASVNLDLQGPPERDRSPEAMAARIDGHDYSDHGFAAVKFPIRIGEAGQLNDGLVGYFVENDPETDPEVLFAPQSATTTKPAPSQGQRFIKTYDGTTPLNLEQSFADRGTDLTLLLDPRGAVHATTGILPTKSIRIPREQFMPSMKRLELAFMAAPLVVPSERLEIPITTEPGHDWSFVSIQDGQWRQEPGVPSITLDDMRRALPGRILRAAGDTFTEVDPGQTNVQGAERYADLLWERLLQGGWITETAPGRARRTTGYNRSAGALGSGFNPTDVEAQLTRITTGIRPAQRRAAFAGRAVAREGWLILSPPQDDDTETALPPAASNVTRNTP